MRGAKDCWEVTWPPSEPRSGGCDTDVANQPDAAVSVAGSAGGSDVPTVIYGFAAPNVARVSIQTKDGITTAPTVPSGQPGDDRRVYAAAYRQFAQLVRVLGIDEQGNIVGTWLAPPN